jgi:hypothetical protein
MDLQSAIWGFGSGVALTVSTALVTAYVTRREERRRLRQAAQFEIYMKLLDLNSLYFWVTVWELHKEPQDPAHLAKIRSLAWEIADRLRQFDDVDYMAEILQVLMAEVYPTAKDRANELDSLLDRLGRSVNPRYSKAIAAVSSVNVAHMAFGSRESRNAPGRAMP